MNDNIPYEDVNGIYKALSDAATIQQKAAITCRDECEKEKEAKQEVCTKEEERYRSQKEQIVSSSSYVKQHLSEIQGLIPKEVILSANEDKSKVSFTSNSIDDGIAILEKSVKKSEELRDGFKKQAEYLAKWRVAYKEYCIQRNIFVGGAIVAVLFILTLIGYNVIKDRNSFIGNKITNQAAASKQNDSNKVPVQKTVTNSAAIQTTSTNSINTNNKEDVDQQAEIEKQRKAEKQTTKIVQAEAARETVVKKEVATKASANQEADKLVSIQNLRDGKRYFDMGKYELCIEKMKEVLKKDRNNSEAEHYVQLAQQKLNNAKSQFQNLKFGSQE